MRITQLRHFLATCQYNSVSRAAAALFVSQPSVSVSIQELEMEFGVQLFHRVNKRLVLSQEGSFFSKKAAAILKDIDMLSDQMQEIGKSVRHLKLGVPPLLGAVLLPSLLCRYQEICSQIQLEIVECGSLAAQEKLESDAVDIALVVETDQVKEQFSSLRVLDTQLVYCVSPGHRLAGCSLLDLRMMHQEPLILFREDAQLNFAIKERLLEAGITPNITLRAAHLPMILQYLAYGNSGAFLLEENAGMYPDIVRIPLKTPLPVSYLLIWKKNRYVNSSVARLQNTVIECLHGVSEKPRS